MCEEWRSGTATFWLHVSSKIPNSHSCGAPLQGFLLDFLLETGSHVAQAGFQPHYRTRDDLELLHLLHPPGIREACHHMWSKPCETKPRASSMLSQLRHTLRNYCQTAILLFSSQLTCGESLFEKTTFCQYLEGKRKNLSFHK